MSARVSLPGNFVILAAAAARQATSAKAIPVTQNGTRSACNSTPPPSASDVQTNGDQAAAPQPDACERALVVTTLVLPKVEPKHRQRRKTLMPMIGTAVWSDVDS